MMRGQRLGAAELWTLLDSGATELRWCRGGSYSSDVVRA